MPVSISEIDRQVESRRFQFLFQRSDQFAILFIDWADAAEQLVVFGNSEHSLARHVATAQNVFEEWHHVVHSFGPSERNDDQRVKNAVRSLESGVWSLCWIHNSAAT